MPPTTQNDEHSVTGEGTRTDMSKVPPLFDADCRHDYQADHTDETDHYIAMVCTKCHRGYLKRKH